MNKSDFHKIENYMLSCMGDSAHDSQHIYRVLLLRWILQSMKKC